MTTAVASREIVRALITKADDSSETTITFASDYPLDKVEAIAESFDQQYPRSVVARKGNAITLRPRGPRNLTRLEMSGFAKQVEDSLTGDNHPSIQIVRVYSLKKLNERTPV